MSQTAPISHRLALSLGLMLILLWTTLTPTRAHADTTAISIADYAFTPSDFSVRTNDTVIWTNDDAMFHTLWVVDVTDQSTHALSTPLAPGDSWSHTFTAPGRFQVFSFHALWITGYLTVQPITPDIAVTAIAVPTTAAVGDLIAINITLQNEGNIVATTNVTTAYNATLLATLSDLRVNPTESSSHTITWNTTGLTPGNYTLAAVADAVPDETDTMDNTLYSGPITLQLHDVAVTQVHPVSTTVTRGDPIAVNVTFINLGSTSETCSISLATNTSLLHTDTAFTLTAGQTRSLLVSWDTASMTPGRYLITADVSPVPGEYMTSNNHAVQELTITAADELPIALIAGLLLIPVAGIAIYLITKRR